MGARAGARAGGAGVGGARAGGARAGGAGAGEEGAGANPRLPWISGEGGGTFALFVWIEVVSEDLSSFVTFVLYSNATVLLSPSLADFLSKSVVGVLSTFDAVVGDIFSLFQFFPLNIVI